MTIGQFLAESTYLLKSENIETARLDIELLLSHQLKLTREQLYTQDKTEISDIDMECLSKLVSRRQKQEPIAYILGYKDFYKYTFLVNKDVLIPRPESEMIIELGIEKAPTAKSIIDLGCGSGCLGLSLAKELRAENIYLVENSISALVVSKKNAESLGLAKSSKFINKDVASLSKDEFLVAPDLIVANPPYIAEDESEGRSSEVQEAVKTFEPHQALFGGKDGLDAIRIWSEKISELFQHPFVFICEFGIDQWVKVKEILEENGNFTDIEIHKDLSGIERIVSCRRKN